MLCVIVNITEQTERILSTRLLPAINFRVRRRGDAGTRGREDNRPRQTHKHVRGLWEENTHREEEKSPVWKQNMPAVSQKVGVFPSEYRGIYLSVQTETTVYEHNENKNNSCVIDCVH